MNNELKRLTRRHIAKTLTSLELVCNLPEASRDIIMTGFNNFSRDVEDNIIKVGDSIGMDKS